MTMVSAFAETDTDIRCWTANEDGFYHMEPGCSGKKMYPISENAALAFGKAPCEKCVVIETPEIIHAQADIRMASRGGTYIICIPSGNLEDDFELPQLEVPESWILQDEAVSAWLGSMLADDDCADIFRRLDADGWARDVCRVPELIAFDDVLSMSMRLADGNWYFTIRPEKPYDSETQLRWRIAEWDIHLESESALTITRSHGAECENTVAVENHDGAGVVFENSYGNLEVTVYREQGMNTAVLRCAGKSIPLTVNLFIGGEDMHTVLNGYINAKNQTVYCCVISDVELANLVAGKMPELRY
ncbi:MAG: hypothetical protein IKM02_02435 [Clostridia bacterium]|nr:hypothetical protein [Clostridia bacterium]